MSDSKGLYPELSSIRLLALDVDGVLTDGRVVWIGDEQRLAFSVRDGAALHWLRREGVQVTWISGRDSKAARARARELGIEELHLGVGDKEAVLRDVQARLEVSAAETAAMGDDLPDLRLAAACGFFAAPADAEPEVRERARLVTVACGGAGAVRELARHILVARGRWQAVVEAHGG